MQEIDTWTSAGWLDSNHFAHYVQAKMMMKSAMDAAHARGMLLRPVPNSVLRLAQKSEQHLSERIEDAKREVGESTSKSAQKRSLQRLMLALLVRKVIKRSMRVNAEDAKKLDKNEEEDDYSLYDGALSSLCIKTLNDGDLQRRTAEEEGREDTWDEKPYTKAREAGINIENDIGLSAKFIRAILLPGATALQHDITAVLSFSLSKDGKTFVGLAAYGASTGTSQSIRPVQGDPTRFQDDFFHLLPSEKENEENLGQTFFRQDNDAVVENGIFYIQYEHSPIFEERRLEPSVLQNRLYDNSVAEIFMLCVQEPDDTISHTDARLHNWASIFLAFCLSMIAAERKSTGEPLARRWISRYAGVLMALPANVNLATAAAAAAEPREAARFFSKAKRGTQELRKIAMELGFRDQPILKTNSFVATTHARVPRFSKSTLKGLDLIEVGVDEAAGGDGGGEGGRGDGAAAGGGGGGGGAHAEEESRGGDEAVAAREPEKRWTVSKDEYVSLYNPSRMFFPLSDVAKAFPLDLNAENDKLIGAVLSLDGKGACPSTRGTGIIKCS